MGETAHRRQLVAGRKRSTVPTLRTLALSFTDHPDFLDEWNP